MDKDSKINNTVDNHNTVDFIENKWHKIGINIIYCTSIFLISFNYFTNKINLEVILIFLLLLVIEEFSKYEITKKKRYIVMTIVYLIIILVSLIWFIIVALK